MLHLHTCKTARFYPHHHAPISYLPRAPQMQFEGRNGHSEMLVTFQSRTLPSICMPTSSMASTTTAVSKMFWLGTTGPNQRISNFVCFTCAALRFLLGREAALAQTKKNDYISIQNPLKEAGIECSSARKSYNDHSTAASTQPPGSHHELHAHQGGSSHPPFSDHGSATIQEAGNSVNNTQCHDRETASLDANA